MKKLSGLFLLLITISCNDPEIYPPTMFDGKNTLNGVLKYNDILASASNNPSELDSATCEVIYKHDKLADTIETTFKKEFKLTTMAQGNYTFNFKANRTLGKETLIYQSTNSLSFENKEKQEKTLTPTLTILKTKSGKAILEVNVKTRDSVLVPKIKTCIYAIQDFRNDFYSCQGSLDSTETNAKGVAYFTGLEAGQTYYLKAVKIANSETPIRDGSGKIIGYEILYLKGDESIKIEGFSVSRPLNRSKITL